MDILQFRNVKFEHNKPNSNRKNAIAKSLYPTRFFFRYAS